MKGADNSVNRYNRVKTYFSKPQNIILLLFGIVLTFSTVAPIIAIVKDTITIHPGTIDAHLAGKASGYTLINYGPLYKPSGEDKPLEAVVEYDPLSSLYLYDLYPLRRNLRISGNKNEPEIQKVFKLHLYFPVHHAAVDVSGCMAERI